MYGNPHNVIIQYRHNIEDDEADFVVKPTSMQSSASYRGRYRIGLRIDLGFTTHVTRFPTRDHTYAYSNLLTSHAW